MIGVSELVVSYLMHTSQEGVCATGDTDVVACDPQRLDPRPTIRGMAWAEVAAAGEAVARYVTFLDAPAALSEAEADALRREFIARGRLWADAELLSARAF